MTLHSVSDRESREYNEITGTGKEIVDRLLVAHMFKNNHLQIGLQEMKRFLYSKGHHYLSEELVSRMGKIFTLHIKQRVNIYNTPKS